MKTNKGIATLGAVIIVLAVLAILGIGGFYFYNSNSVSGLNNPYTNKVNSNFSSQQNTSIPTTNNNNVSPSRPNSNEYPVTCDLSKISSITASSPSNPTIDYSVSGGKIFGKNNYDATSMIKGVICIPGIGGTVSQYLSYGGNMDGKWFTINTGGKVTNLNMKEIIEGSQTILVMEDRIATVLPASTVFKAGNYVYIRQREIYKDTGLIHRFVSMYIQGSDVMLDKSIEEIGSLPNPVDHYIPVTYTYK